MKVLLEAWARVYFDPAPSVHTLRRLARDGHIAPPPVKVGKHWYVDEKATLWGDSPAAGTLVDRLKRGGR